MVLRSTRAAAVAAAAVIALSACTAPESGDPTDAPDSSADATTTAQAESQDATEAPSDASGPEVQSTTGAVVEGMPEVIVPMPDAEIVSSSVQPAGDGQPVGVSITMRVEESEEDVLDFYADHFDDAGFEPVGDPESEDGVTTQTYHADDAGQLVSIGISNGSGEEEGLLVTVGGQVLP